MAEQGFNGTSMRDLAQETGRSLSGLYHYFRSKEDLLFLINFYGFTTLNTSWRKLVVELEEPHEKLYAFIFFHMSYFIEHMDEMRVMTWGTQVLNLEKARMIQKLKDQYTNAAKQIVQEMRRTSALDEIDDRQLSRETYLLFGMMNWTFGWYSSKKHGSVTDLISRCARR
jgi:AcrR family transcriptional regulator